MLTTYQLILSYQKLNYLRWYNQSDFFVDIFLVGSLLKTGLPLTKNVIKPLTKIPLGLTAAAQ